ncbi:MAG: hypothetical protein KF875_12365 [Trueperaceae bacterium]|nr:hypothetical protein [Trueperaceae bacterium]
MRILLTRSLAACLSVGLLGGPIGLPSSVALAAGRPSISGDETGRLLAALMTARQELPRDTFDTFSALDQTDFTAEGAFAWVRDETRLVPYLGALRGASGVLLDREGNSLDRTLLLQDLLDALGYDTRLVRGTLSEETAAGLLAGVRGRDWQRTWERAALTDLGEPTTPAELAERFGVDAALVREAARLTTERAAALEAAMAERTSAQTALLSGMLGALAPAGASGPGGAGGPTGATDAHERALLDALADHWWLQYQDESGAWVDLDPSLTGGEPGSTLTTADETLDAFGLAELPAELTHRVSLAVVLECVVDGALSETTLVATEPLLPSRLLGQRVSFTVLPGGLTEEIAADPDALIEKLMSEQHWYPTINVGDVTLTDLEFSPACETSPYSPSSLGTAISDTLFGAMDTLFGAGPAEDAVSALRLEFRSQRPGADDVVLARHLFDALGPAKRAAGDLRLDENDAARLAWRLKAMGETEALVTAGGVSRAFAADLAARALLAGESGLRAFADGVGEQAKAQPEAVAPSALLALVMERQKAQPTSLYQAEANVFLRHTWLEDGEHGLARHQALDFVRADLASYSDAATARAERMAQGVADTNAEALIVRQLCEDDATAEYCLPYGNAAERMAASPAAGSWLVLASLSEVDAVLPTWSADARASLAADLRAGFAAVAPATLEPSGRPATWWRVDPATGAVLGVSESGRGDAAVEYGMLVNVIGLAFCMVGAVSADSISALLLCGFGFATGTGVLLGSATAVGHGTGLLMVLSAVLYGLGGLGIPGGP